jgi:ABC-type transport system involved in multi-copper enzyme maturation permease subunit
MKSIIWKELRENLKWAALALLCLTLAEIYALYQYRNRFFTFHGDSTLCNSDFLFVSAVGCALVGAALGAIQILPELRRDQWAALLHRPVPRSTIFFGKVVAGLLLYLPATLVPLLLSVIYVNIPGQFGVPFVPGMVLPAVSDLLLGIVIYFAALLVSLSQGPWYGKRALLALSVVPLIVFHFVMGWFSPLLIAAAIFMMAAHSTMMSHGAGGKEPRLGRICFILVLFAGVEAVLFLVITALSFLPHAGEKIPPGFIFRDFRVADTGRVFISEINLTTSERKLIDTDGKPVADERYVGNNGPNPFCYLADLFPDRWLPGAPLERYRARHRRSGNNYFELIDGTFDEDSEAWYLDIQGNYFIGYDKVSRLCVGICDREGFHKAGTSPRPFSEHINIAWSLNHPPRFWTRNQLYRINFLERTMSLLFNSGAETIYSAIELAPPPMRKEVYEAVALKKEVRILDWNGAPLVIIPYDHDVNSLASLDITTSSAGDRIFLEYVSARRDRANPREIPPPSLLEEIDFFGKSRAQLQHGCD